VKLNESLGRRLFADRSQNVWPYFSVAFTRPVHTFLAPNEFDLLLFLEATATTTSDESDSGTAFG